MTRFDSTARVFRDDLLQRADKKRKQALDAKKRKVAAKAAKVGNQSKSSQALSAIHEALQALAELIASQGQGPVKFIVEERDLNGKVKSFKAE